MTAALSLALVRRSDQEWISAEEVIRRTGWTDRWLREKVSAGTVIARESERLAGNGRRLREYLASSLPCAQTQLAVVAPPASALGPLFASQAASHDRTILPDPKAEQEAAQRYAIIEPLRDFIAAPDRFSHLVVNGRRVDSQERMIDWVIAQNNGRVSKATVKRWLKRFRSSGRAALADRVRADKGQSRWFAQHRKAATLAAYLYLDQRQSVAFIHEQLVRELNLGEDDRPSYETVRGFLAHISPALSTLAREGRRAYAEAMTPYLRRGYVDVAANQVWVCDHMIHDVEVANDLFDEAEPGAPVRLRLTAFIDYRSRKVVGASWAWEGSSRSLATAMARGIRQFGPPEMIYTDNGKDMRKMSKGAVRGSDLNYQPRSPIEPEGWWKSELESIERTGFLARLGVAITHCLPYHPQSKHVERFFRTLHERFDAVHSTYTSGSPFTRPELTEMAMMRHRRLLKAGRVNESNHPLASRFILGCLSWIEEYNDTAHRGEGMDGRTPNEVFKSELNPDQKPTPDASVLAMLMSEWTTRTVDSCAVRLNKTRYTPRPEDRAAWAAMHHFNTQEILVAYNPSDMQDAAALDKDGRFVAWLQAETLLRFAPGDPTTQKQIAQRMEIGRGLEKATRQTIQAVANEARGNGARSAEEMLYSRLQLPAAAGEVITQRKPRLRANRMAVAPPTASDIAASILEDLK